MRCALSSRKCTKTRFPPGLRPGPRWGSLRRSLRPAIVSLWGGQRDTNSPHLSPPRVRHLDLDASILRPLQTKFLPTPTPPQPVSRSHCSSEVWMAESVLLGTCACVWKQAVTPTRVQTAAPTSTSTTTSSSGRLCRCTQSGKTTAGERQSSAPRLIVS